MKPIYRCRICGMYVENPIHCGSKAEIVLDATKRVALSKLMSFLLRHDPSAAALSMDREGWVSIKDLVEGIRSRWRNSSLYRWVKEEHVIAIALLDPKGRFELRNGMIRARYGHSKKLHVSIEYPKDVDSKYLYHGTTRRNLVSILREGIKPMNRHYVHLTLDVDDACTVGKRHGDDTITLLIDAECVRRLGIDILIGSKHVRLVSYVPPQCIKMVLNCKGDEGLIS